MKPHTSARIEFVTYQNAPQRLGEVLGEQLAKSLLEEAAENRSEAWEAKTWRTFYGGSYIPVATACC
eukprot:7922928-Karenia_brevis.AAC.1